jgi:hypothetical protein
MKPRNAPVVERHDWDARAVEALDAARKLPLGPLRSEALRKANLLRIAADSIRFFLPRVQKPQR